MTDTAITDTFDSTRASAHPISRAAMTAENGTACQFLTFTIGAEEYGVDIMAVREIKGWTETTRLPGTPDFMRGVINLRGLIIPIFDLRTRFHLGHTEATGKHVVIVLAVGDRNIGILVDAVSDILDTDTAAIKEPPVREGATEAEAQSVSGLISHNDRMVVLLDVEKLFDTTLVDGVANAT
jgi:purine-binding chemotaxis protein CheW